ncbi:DUF4314 domain-containing protein [Paenibacillus aestuarii]|uniref:DUF4314 domain-containing protein n=1 Tax=Paenibacillus aestuarii TaxID=516965 RepID=A0ABW0K8Z4_9BACL
MNCYEIISYDKDSSYIAKMREDHPEGTTIVLIHLNNLFFPVRTKRGVVKFVDEAGCVCVDFGGNLVSLNYRFGDRWRIITET